jgi:hypothetical protein
VVEKQNYIIKTGKLSLVGFCLSAFLVSFPCLALEGSANQPLPNAQPVVLVWQVDDSNPSMPAVQAGSQFNIILQAKVDSKDAQIGDSVKATLASDLFVDKQKFASKGDSVSGFIVSVDRARQSLKSDLPSHHWLDANGGLGLHFTQITTSQGKRFNIDALPKADSFVIEDTTSGAGPRPALITNKQGEVMIYFHNARDKGLSVAIDGASIASCFALGPLGLLVAPAISGAAGLASPSYAYDRPVDPDTTAHSKLKGLFRGMVEGLPGGFLISGVANHGLDVELAPGDKMTLQLQSNLVL